MPVEVGVGYVSVVPETRGFGRLLTQQISGESARAGTSAGQEAGDGFLGGLGGKVKAGAAGVAVAGGALFAAGFAQAVEQDKATAKLGASLGLSEKATARAGKVAGSIYAQGYGESIDDVDESLKSLQRNGVAALSAPRKQLAGLSKDALNLADVFDADVADSTKAVGKLMSTGLVKNAKQGFDLLTAGFQSGADQAGDLIDTVNEYSTQWRKAGLSGSTAIGLINQGLKAGARDGDLVADSIKEFSIRAIDGSTSTASGFKALGLSADDMAGKFAKGGKSANGVLQLTLDRLRGIKDPVKQAQIATSLFGTQAEDLGKALFALDPSKAADGLGKVGGAAGRMGKTLSNTASHDIEVFKRQALQGLASFAAKYALPALRRTGSFLTTYVLPPAKQVGGVLIREFVPAVKSTASALAAGAGWVQKYGAWLIPLAVAVGGVTLAMNASAIATGLAMGVMGAYSLLVRGVVAITRVWTATQAVFNGVMALNPITLIVIGVLALAAAAVVAFKKVGWFHDAVMTAWSGIKAGWDVLWNGALKPGFEYLKIGLTAIGAAASWLWSAVSPAFSAIATAGKILFTVLAVIVIAPIILYLKLLGAVAGWLWTNAFGPAFRGIVTLAGWWWSGVKVYFGLVKAGLSAVGAVGMWLYRNAISPAFHGIVTLASWWWSGVKLYFGLVRTGITAVGSAGTWLYRTAIKPAFQGIASVASWLWSKGLKPAFDAGRSAVALFAGAFDTAQKGIGKAFGKIKDATRRPVAFVVNTVYTNGIKKVWDGVAGFVGLDKLPAAKFARGGRTRGGTPGKDSIPSLMMADEFVVKRSSARRIGFGALDYMNRTGELPVQRFADGGIVGDALSWVGGKAKQVGSAVMDGVDFLSNPGKLWNKAIAPVRSKIAQVGQSKYAQMIGKVPLKMLSSLKDKIVDAATSAFGGGSGDIGGSGVKRWSSVVLQALKMVGQPASLLSTVLRRMNQESGGNPRAINNWDVNARNGDPSRGLMQTIGATFNAYAGKLRGRGIYDPLANIYASMRYALSRYGSLASAYNRPGGYASGGRPSAGELAWVGEQGPELVRFGSGNSTVFDHRTSLGMVAGLGVRGFAKGTAGAKSARKQVPGDLTSFTKSLTGSASTIASASKSLAEDLKKTGKAGKALAEQVGKTSSKLQSLAKQRDAVAGKLATAKQAAADQKKSAADYLSLTSVGDVSSIGDLIAGMQSRQTTLRGNESLIKQAQKKGVSQSVIRQLVAAGPDSNLAQLVAGANAGDVKKINSLAASGAKLSTSYGNYMADAMYDSGVNAGKGFLTGLQSQEKALQQQMRKLGGVLVDTIEKRLDINSPSRETERVGEMVGAGVVVGSDRALADVRAGAARLGTAAIPPVVPVSAGQPAQAVGLRKGDTLILRVGEREMVAVVDERVDAGLSDVRARGRAGRKG
ncbi:phage tail tape measure protein [Streptomyces sp. NPDC005548]|uniref:phage tail tape measure protein n=1 Tax=Streptomyces sp. NPDC005548 TaxID=3364724 RepID=UPI0036AE4A9A